MAKAAPEPHSPTRYQAKPARKRPRSLNEVRIKDLQNLASYRRAFVTESPAGIILLEVLAQHLAFLIGDPRKRIARLLDEQARWYGIERADDLLERLKSPKWWKAAELGWHLRLTEQERTKLKICTIEAAGVSPEQRKELNRERRRQKAAERRQKAGSKPRAQWLADHSEKPWIAAGISRAKWYRLKRETGP